jgi:hypothetical protein
MTADRTRLLVYTCLGIIFLGASNGCKWRPASYTFSPVIEGKFEPVKALETAGYEVKMRARGETVRNPTYGYGWQSWCGVVVSSDKPVACRAIAETVRDELDRAIESQSLDELTGRYDDQSLLPLSGMLRYNKGNMHGDVHVWLTPDSAQGSVNYVIYLREEVRD